jgi:putative phosphotransacetylase
MSSHLVKVPVEISARHVHLSQIDQDKLFGPGYKMKIVKELSQPGQWAAEEKIIVRGSRGEFECRVLGPCRKTTQVELSKTDCLKIGLEPVLRLSGDHEGTPGCTLIGPKGETQISSGVIVAKRHIHLSDEEAVARGLKSLGTVAVRITGERDITFHEVILRTDPSFHLHLHLDTDEGNAAWQETGGSGEILT